MQTPKKKRAVFLDRDGVINRTFLRDGKPRAPDRLEEFEYFSGVPEAVEKLRNAGFLLVVVTNQPDVARGWQTRDRVEQMNEKLVRELKVDAIQVCYHVDEDGCACRKPQPGMLLDAARALDIDVGRSFMVGDRESDIQAGRAAGCAASIFVGEDPCPQHAAARASSLLEAAEWILSRG